MRRYGTLLIAVALVMGACGSGDRAPSDDSQNDESTSTTAASSTSTVTPMTTSTMPNQLVSMTENVGGLDVIVMPAADGSLPPDLVVVCRAGIRFPLSALEDVPLLADVDEPGIEEAVRWFLDSGEGAFWQQDGWRLLHRTPDEAIVVAVSTETEEPGISYMTISRSEGAWQWTGSGAGGDCTLMTALPDGMNTVDWHLDPSEPAPTADSQSIHVLVTETACADGEAVGDRLRGPQVIVTDTAALITFAAVAQGGMHTCPSNPETPVTIELSGPLGSRVLRDGLNLGIDLTKALDP